MRITTNTVLKNYKLSLNKSYSKKYDAQTRVLTQRNFNTYAEDPSSATQAFKLRRSFLRTTDQITNSNAVINKFSTAYQVLDNTAELATEANSSILRALNDPTGTGRAALGQSLQSTSESIVQLMNSKYGDSFVFAGSDGLNVPFSWDSTKGLLYRGIAVDSTDPADTAMLKFLSGESAYMDIGMGLKETSTGELITSSAFNSALSGLDFLGYGTDSDGDPKNLASIVKELGTILSRCDSTTGEWASEQDTEDANRLQLKLADAMGELTSKTTDLSTQANFLNTNLTQLKDSATLINEQIVSIEDCELADAISAFSWAQYCYNAALKIGNSVLSQSLMDYLK